MADRVLQVSTVAKDRILQLLDNQLEMVGLADYQETIGAIRTAWDKFHCVLEVEE